MGHCVMKNPAAGGGRWVEVPPERLVTWVVTFAQRHGGVTLDGPATPDETGAAITFTAADGATAECYPPFPPVPSGVPAGDVRAAAEALAAHAAADRTVGVLLVRLGGYAAGVFSGSPPRLVDSKTGSRPVHGRRGRGVRPLRPGPSRRRRTGRGQAVGRRVAGSTGGHPAGEVPGQGDRAL